MTFSISSALNNHDYLQGPPTRSREGSLEQESFHWCRNESTDDAETTPWVSAFQILSAANRKAQLPITEYEWQIRLCS